MATVSLYLDRRRAKKDGSYPLKFIVYNEGKNKPYSFDKKISLTEVQFEKLCSKKLKNEELQNIRKYTDREIGRALDVIGDAGEDFSYELFEAYFFKNVKVKKGSGNRFYSVFEQYIEDLRGAERFGSAECYLKSMQSFKKFAPDLQIKDITPTFFERYEKWFLDKGCSVATLQGHVYTIRTIINIAIRKKLMSHDHYPFGMKADKKYEIPVPGKVNRALTVADIRKVREYECNNPEEEFSRDMWLFSFYCNGMNMVDVFSLKFKDLQDNFFSFHRTKTKRTRKNKTPVEVHMTDKVTEILNKWSVKNKDPENYVFDVFDVSMSEKDRFGMRKYALGKINRHTKSIGHQLGISLKLTSYAARNSWATVVCDELGGSVREVSEGLGHSTLAMTQKYLDSFPQERKKQTANRLSSLV